MGSVKLMQLCSE